MPATSTSTPAVVERRRDRCTREIRLELAEHRTRTGGVYDLPRDEQARLLLPGHLPGWGDFLPDFVIVLGMGDPPPTPEGAITWDDLRIHVGGLQWRYLTDGGNPQHASANASASAEWHRLDVLLNGTYRQDPAPGWLLNLIAAHTPWADLLHPTD